MQQVKDLFPTFLRAELNIAEVDVHLSHALCSPSCSASPRYNATVSLIRSQFLIPTTFPQCLSSLVSRCTATHAILFSLESLELEERTIMTSPLSEFRQIGPRTSLYTPSKPEAGQLIILCTWLGAGRKHIAKYTSLYQHLAPGSRILLVQSAVPILISSYAHQRKAIQSAVSVILDTLSECVEQAPEAAEKLNGGLMKAPEQNTTQSSISSATTVNEKKPKIMLHTFSNGGTNTATQVRSSKPA